MAKFGEYAKTGVSGEYEMLSEDWHEVVVSEVEILDQKKYMSEETEKKLKVVFETIEETNSNGYPFKVFHWLRAEVDPTYEKTALHKLLMGLLGEIPGDIFEREIEEVLVGKKVSIMTKNKPNKDRTKTFSEILNFRPAGQASKFHKSKKNLDIQNLSPEEKALLLQSLMGNPPASENEAREKTLAAIAGQEPVEDMIDFEDVPF